MKSQEERLYLRQKAGRARKGRVGPYTPWQGFSIICVQIQSQQEYLNILQTRDGMRGPHTNHVGGAVSRAGSVERRKQEDLFKNIVHVF